MAENVIDYGRTKIKAAGFIGPTSGGSSAASGVTVAAGTDGLAAGNVQAALQALASRIAELET